MLVYRCKQTENRKSSHLFMYRVGSWQNIMEEDIALN